MPGGHSYQWGPTHGSTKSDEGDSLIMEDLNLAGIQGYTIQVNYEKNKVLNYINFKTDEGITAMKCGLETVQSTSLLIKVPG